MPPLPERKNAGILRAVLKHALGLSILAGVGYVVYGAEAPGKMLYAFVVTLSAFAFCRVFGRTLKK